MVDGHGPRACESAAAISLVNQGWSVQYWFLCCLGPRPTLTTPIDAIHSSGRWSVSRRTSTVMRLVLGYADFRGGGGGGGLGANVSLMILNRPGEPPRQVQPSWQTEARRSKEPASLEARNATTYQDIEYFELSGELMMHQSPPS